MSSYILCIDCVNNKSFILNLLCGNVKFEEYCQKIFNNIKENAKYKENIIDNEDEYNYTFENDLFIIYKNIKEIIIIEKIIRCEINLF